MSLLTQNLIPSPWKLTEKNIQQDHLKGGEIHAYKIENEGTSAVLIIRIPKNGQPRIEEVAVTTTHTSITGTQLRSIPLGAIENALNHKYWLTSPIPGPRKSADFIPRAAVQFTAYTLMGKTLSDMAAANGVSDKTVEGWLTEARKRGLLPALKPGRRPGNTP